MTHASMIRLGELAVTRSGDKGNHANLGVWSRDPTHYEHLLEHLTAERMADFFKPWGVSDVRRFELPKLHALNFMLYNALAGGAGESLRIDSQGKLLGTAVQRLELPAPRRPQSTESGT